MWNSLDVFRRLPFLTPRRTDVLSPPATSKRREYLSTISSVEDVRTLFLKFFSVIVTFVLFSFEIDNLFVFVRF